MTSYMTASLIPACKHTPDRNIELIWKIHNIPELSLLDAYHYELSGAESQEEYRQMLIELIEGYWELGYRNDVSMIYAGDDLPYYITGGLTGGDSPTAPFDTIAMLAEVIWNDLLEYAKQDWSLISGKEVIESREEAKTYFLGVDDIIIPDNARVQKVSYGYWVEARMWADAEYSDSPL